MQPVMGRLSRLLPEAGLELLRAAARGEGLDYDPVPVRAWHEGGPFIALVRALGGRVLTTEQFTGWIAGDHGRHWPAHYGPFAQDLSLTHVCVDDFQGAVLVELDGARYLALRTDAVLDPPYISAALIIGAPSLPDALALLDRLEAKREELAGARVRAFGTSLGWLDVAPVPESDLVLPEPFKEDLLASVSLARNRPDLRHSGASQAC